MSIDQLLTAGRRATLSEKSLGPHTRRWLLGLSLATLALTRSAAMGAAYYDQAQPTITSLGPNFGPVGTVVTISGSSVGGADFGATQGSSTVTFNGTNAGTASSWSASQHHDRRAQWRYHGQRGGDGKWGGQ